MGSHLGGFARITLISHLVQFLQRRERELGFPRRRIGRRLRLLHRDQLQASTIYRNRIQADSMLEDPLIILHYGFTLFVTFFKR